MGERYLARISNTIASAPRKLQARAKHVPRESKLPFPCGHQWFFAVRYGTANRGESCSTSERPTSDDAHTLHISIPRRKYIAFTDQDSRKLKILQSGSTVKVIPGTEGEGNKNGSKSHSAFGQPMGVCAEGTSIFVVDGQIGTIKLVPKLEETAEF